MDVIALRRRELVIKAAVVHTVTYFVAGVCASLALDYAHAFNEPGLAGYMRGLDDGLVRAGPLFQPLRGALFGLAFHPLREVLFGRPRGWAVLWLVLVVVGIVGPFGAAPGSLEGLVYTTVSVRRQLLGFLEIVPQALALSIVLFIWVTRPERRWLSWTLGSTFAVIMLLCTLGAVVGPEKTQSRGEIGALRYRPQAMNSAIEPKTALNTMAGNSPRVR